MLCTYQYQYRYRGNRELGGYQCDIEDFRKWFKAARGALKTVVVTLQNGERWIWSRAMYNVGVGSRTLRDGRRGWQRIRRWSYGEVKKPETIIIGR